MKNAWGIFLHDAKALLHSPAAFVLSFAIVIVSSAFAWYSIAALWNPYAHTGDLKVAVVNNDAGAKELNAGSLVIEAAQQDSAYDWQIVDAAQGEAGLASGEYYAEFVLPEDFTADILDAVSGDADSPTIEYWVNEKYGISAVGTAEAGLGVVDSVINRTFSALISSAISDAVKNAASDMVVAGNAGGSAMRTGIEGAKRDVANAVSSVGHAKKAIEEWSKAIADAQRSLDSLKETIPGLRTSIEDGEKQLAGVRTSVHEVENAYSSALSQGGEELATVLDQVSSRISKVASEISSKQDAVEAALKKAKDTLAECRSLIETLRKADPGSSTLSNLEKRAGALETEIGDLEKATGAVGDSADKADDAAAELSKDVDDMIKSLKGRDGSFNSTTLPQLDTSLDSLAFIMGRLDGVLGSLEAQANQAKTLLDQLKGVIGDTEGALDATAKTLDSVEDDIASARSDLAALANSKSKGLTARAADAEGKSRDSSVKASVQAEIKQVYPPSSYGAGVAPFFTCLAIWIACFMLIVVAKLGSDSKRFPGAKPWQGRLGRLLLFAALMLVQGVIVTVGEIVLGVNPIGPVSFVLAGAVTAFCFIGVTYALAVTFEHIGKALVVILLAIQIPAALGLYPHELMPGIAQAVGSWLPFTYGMGAMREALSGFFGMTYVQCLAWLLGCGSASLVLALFVRPRMANVSFRMKCRLAPADAFLFEESAEDAPAPSQLAAESGDVDE